MSRETILVTGGTGYIGSHAAVERLAAGRDVFVVDNLCNRKLSVLERVARIAGRKPGFAQLDIRDRTALRALFAANRFAAVVHCTGLKAVGESMQQALTYYNNVSASEVLVQREAKSGNPVPDEQAGEFLVRHPLRASRPPTSSKNQGAVKSR